MKEGIDIIKSYFQHKDADNPFGVIRSRLPRFQDMEWRCRETSTCHYQPAKWREGIFCNWSSARWVR